MADIPLVTSPVALELLAGADVAAGGQVPTADGTGGVAWGTPTGTAGATETVNHGNDGTTARPDTSSPVLWVGDAEPANWLDGDVWVDSASPDGSPTWVVLTQAEYDALTPDASTVYMIVG